MQHHIQEEQKTSTAPLQNPSPVDLQKIQIEDKQIITALGWLMSRTYSIAAIFIILATYSFHLILIFILHFHVNTLRMGSFKLFKRLFPGFLTILTL